MACHLSFLAKVEHTTDEKYFLLDILDSVVQVYCSFVALFGSLPILREEATRKCFSYGSRVEWVVVVQVIQLCYCSQTCAGLDAAMSSLCS